MPVALKAVALVGGYYLAIALIPTPKIGIVDLNTQVADSALDLGVTEQQLYSPQVTGSSVDQGRLGPAERVGPEHRWI